MAAVVKQLKIKTNSLKRVHKELSYYEAEHAKDQSRLEQMKAAEAEAHDIKQAEGVVSESAMMIPETRQRLEAALAELQSFLAANQQDVPEDAEELVAAKEALEAAEAVFKS